MDLHQQILMLLEMREEVIDLNFLNYLNYDEETFLDRPSWSIVRCFSSVSAHSALQPMSLPVVHAPLTVRTSRWDSMALTIK